MQPRKLDILVATFCYGGVGASRNTTPDSFEWLLKNVPKWREDERIGRIAQRDFGDTPITMNRNAAVKFARDNGFDLLLMIDSDQAPDCELGRDADAKPFWEEAFNFIYKNYEKGPHVVCAPYCGPPAEYENCYVFFWDTFKTDDPNDLNKLEAYSRSEAAKMSGIHPCAAAPTGLILFDVRAFDLTEPEDEDDDPWFYYEWTDKYCTQKGSTEDVTATRDISLAGIAELGYNPLHCAWSSWAGHWKPKCVSKPRLFEADGIADKMQRAMQNNIRRNEKRKFLDFPLPPGAVVHDHSGNGKAAPLVRKGTTEFEQFQEQLRELAQIHRHPEHADMFLPGESFTPAHDLDALTRLVKKVSERFHQRPIRCLEVGSWVGESARAILRGFGPKGGKLWCVDTWAGSKTDYTGCIAEDYREDVFGLFQKHHAESIASGILIPVRGESVEVARTWETLVDLVFIDAGHTYEECKADILAWADFVNLGGIICGHDYGDEFPGVKQAVTELFGVPSANGVTVEGTVWSGVVRSRSLAEVAA